MAGLQLDNVYQPFSKLFQWLHRHAATAGASSPDSRQQPPDFVIGGVTEKYTAMRIDSGSDSEPWSCRGRRYRPLYNVCVTGARPAGLG
jgi:hypothetical protein